MTLTLTDHCSMTVLPSYEGSKDDKVGLKICFFALLHVWLCHVLSLYKDTFLCSMQIYSARRFYVTPPPQPPPVDRVGRAFKGLSFLPFLCVLHVFRRRRGERPSDGRKPVETLVCPPVAQLRGLKG